MERARASSIHLRDVVEQDLPAFFEHQRDPEANRMAVFKAREREAFFEHWNAILSNHEVIKRTVLVGGEVAGNLVCFEAGGRRLVGYWIARQLWGRGVATEALSQFVALVPFRPLHAFVATSNVGSIRVLEKCGFTPIEERTKADFENEALAELLFALER